MAEQASALYKDAIKQLEALSADFRASDAARQEANAKISALRVKAQDAALDKVEARSANLQALVSNLTSVLQKAQGGASPLQALVDRAKKALAG